MPVPEWDEFVCTALGRLRADPARSRRSARTPSTGACRSDVIGLADGHGPARSLLFMDPPDHTRLRKLVSQAFTPRTVEQLRPHVAELVDGMLDDVDPAGFDLIEAVGLPAAGHRDLRAARRPRGRPAPVRPVELRRCRGCSTATSTRPRSNAGLDAPSCSSSTTSTTSSRSAGPTPRDDLVSALLAVEEEGDRLTEEELRSIVLLLFVAGHETTMNLIGNGTVALLRSRDQWDRARAPTRRWRPSAVEELLRFDGPVHVTAAHRHRADRRSAASTVEPGQGGDRHWRPPTATRSASTDPDRLDIARPDVQHLTFSHGIHYCLGAALARLEGQEVFKALTQRFPALELAEEPVHREHFVLRGYRAVHSSRLSARPRPSAMISR